MITGKKIVNRILAIIILPALLLAGAAMGPQAPASAESRDCDNNAVIYCGALSVGGMIHKYDRGDGRNSAKSIRSIFGAFGIGPGDIRGMRGSVQDGVVTKSGNVYVGGKLVATNAFTAGRQHMDGSARHSNDGTVFYTRKPSVSFQSDKLRAFVVMKNGTFQFAVLTSCGNPVKASPRKPHHKQHMGIGQARPVKHAPRKRPPPVNTTNVCNGDTSNTNSGVASQGGNCSTNTTNNTSNTNVTKTTIVKTTSRQRPPAPPAPAATQAPAEAVVETPVQTTGATTPAALPNVGAGNLLGLFGATATIGTIGYRIFLGRRLGGPGSDF